MQRSFVDVDLRKRSSGRLRALRLTVRAYCSRDPVATLQPTSPRPWDGPRALSAVPRATASYRARDYAAEASGWHHVDFDGDGNSRCGGAVTTLRC